MTSENTAPPVQVALARAMADVRGVGKGERNSYHGFNFRGIDSVLNAVGPALRAHQVIPVPKVLEQHSEWVKTTKNKDERLVNLTVQYTFIGPDGGKIETIVVGEASDQGDKAISKAMSVALRTALIQTLALPTDEEDPDAHSPEFSSAPASRQEGQEGSAHQPGNAPTPNRGNTRDGAPLQPNTYVRDGVDYGQAVNRVSSAEDFTELFNEAEAAGANHLVTLYQAVATRWGEDSGKAKQVLHRGKQKRAEENQGKGGPVAA